MQVGAAACARPRRDAARRCCTDLGPLGSRPQLLQPPLLLEVASDLQSGGQPRVGGAPRQSGDAGLMEDESSGNSSGNMALEIWTGVRSSTEQEARRRDGRGRAPRTGRLGRLTPARQAVPLLPQPGRATY